MCTPNSYMLENPGRREDDQKSVVERTVDGARVGVEDFRKKKEWKS